MRRPAYGNLLLTQYAGRAVSSGGKHPPTRLHTICKASHFLHNAVGFYLNPAYKTVNREQVEDYSKRKYFYSSQIKEMTAMYQKIIVPIDHGNRNMKTEHKVFTSGFVEGACRPALGEYLHYNGRYYALAEQRIPYMRDKTVDDRFFILTLFAVAMEAEKQMFNKENTILQAVLPVGLPPKHYGTLYRKFEDYFKRRGIQQFTYKGIPYKVEITDAVAFPQDYAAAMTVYQRITGFNKVITVDIGGFTLDYLLIRGGRPDLGVCDSLEKGVIKLYNDVASRINSEKDILLDDTDIDRIIRGEKTDYDGEVLRIVGDMTRTFVDDILGTLRERGLDLKTSCVVFIGGGAMLLKKYLESSDKTGRSIFVEDICANAKGYGLLYQVQRKGR